jgi:predicted O-methyltransferase YrrM
MGTYASRGEIPRLVRDAQSASDAQGFPRSSARETGRLLRVLAAHAGTGTIGEIGTGAGVGAAWIASGMQPGARFFTVELDDDRARAARHLFAGVPGITVLHGPWEDILAHGPFDLLFIDAKPAKIEGARLAAGALSPGGMAVLDDLTPEDVRPDVDRANPDDVREFWLNHPDLVATEVMMSRTMSVVLAARAGRAGL